MGLHHADGGRLNGAAGDQRLSRADRRGRLTARGRESRRWRAQASPAGMVEC